MEMSDHFHASTASPRRKGAPLIYLDIFDVVLTFHTPVFLCQSHIWCECMVMKSIDIGSVLNLVMEVPGMQRCVVCKWSEHCNLTADIPAEGFINHLFRHSKVLFSSFSLFSL